MIELLHDAPWWLPTLIILLFFAAIWLTHFVAYGRGRLDGLHEADRRERHRDRCSYEQGVIDTARRAGEFLRNRGARADAAALPIALLNDRSPTQR